jgi:DNA-binding protein H-NS
LQFVFLRVSKGALIIVDEENMAKFDLGAMSLEELKALQKDVAAAIDDFHDRQKADARRALEDLAREKGFSLAELVALTPKKSRKPVAAKYAHPENPQITWSGRGRKPRWVIEALEAGKTLEDLAI